MPNWKVGLNIERYIRYGYLGQDDNGQIYLDWRTRAEVDQKALINMLLSSDAQKAETTQPQEETQKKKTNKLQAKSQTECIRI